ncbi:MAG: copper amine oxidase N-terminal domain-containing protein [Defluviitaleaceae bacterium]|nr:copper amine oxidase N-terminal domain-containing protein [Defluviitaleaceae bacterium]
MKKRVLKVLPLFFVLFVTVCCVRVVSEEITLVSPMFNNLRFSSIGELVDAYISARDGIVPNEWYIAAATERSFLTALESVHLLPNLPEEYQLDEIEVFPSHVIYRYRHDVPEGIDEEYGGYIYPSVILYAYREPQENWELGYSYEMASVIRIFNITEDDFIDGKYYISRNNNNNRLSIYWADNGIRYNASFPSALHGITDFSRFDNTDPRANDELDFDELLRLIEVVTIDMQDRNNISAWRKGDFSVFTNLHGEDTRPDATPEPATSLACIGPADLFYREFFSFGEFFGESLGAYVAGRDGTLPESMFVMVYTDEPSVAALEAVHLLKNLPKDFEIGEIAVNKDCVDYVYKYNVADGVDSYGMNTYPTVRFHADREPQENWELGYSYQIAHLMNHFDITEDDFIDGKYYIPSNYNDNRLNIYWADNGILFRASFPHALHGITDFSRFDNTDPRASDELDFDELLRLIEVVTIDMQDENNIQAWRERDFSAFDSLPSEPTPTDTTPITQPTTSATFTARPTDTAILIDEAPFSLQAYNIEGRSFFKLRDIATILKDTTARFDVSWDSEARAVLITTGTAYEPVSEEAPDNKDTLRVEPTTATIFVDGVRVDFTVFNIGGHNYFMLRELGESIGITIDWDNALRTILISYIERTTP